MRTITFPFFCALLAVLAMACTRNGESDKPAVVHRELVVSAAASLKEAFTRIGEELKRGDSNLHVSFNFGASNLLARQIREGAPVDLFASAAEDVMDSLDALKLLSPNTRQSFAANNVVLVGGPEAAPLTSLSQLLDPRFKRIAVASPGVPVRTYTEESLRKAGIWDSLQTRFVFGGNVRQVLDYVARGEADAGFVYTSDLTAAAGRARTLLTLPADLHRPITYPIAILAHAKDRDDADRFIALLTSPTGGAILQQHGFIEIAAPGH